MYGILALISLVYICDYILKQYGYERLDAHDLVMVYENPGSHHNIVGYFEINKISIEELEQLIYSRGVSKIWKLSTVLVEFCEFYLWKEIDPEIARKQVFKTDIELKNDEDCMQYLNQMANQKMDFTKPLWEFRLVEDYADGKSVVFYKMHHCFMDGVGFV